MVEPLSALGVAPLVHCSGDVFFNQILVTWLLPMIAERTGDPVAFAEKTVKGDVGYDSPEWLETFQTIADLRTSGVLLEGSGATDYGAMQQLLLQGKAAMTFNGTWLLPLLLGGSPTTEFDLHVVPPPSGRRRNQGLGRSWRGPVSRCRPHPPRAETACMPSWNTRAGQRSTGRSWLGMQVYSPIEESNVAIENEIAQEFLPDVRERHHVSRLALGARDHGRDRQSGPSSREGRRPILRRPERPSRPSPRTSVPPAAATTPESISIRRALKFESL